MRSESLRTLDVYIGTTTNALGKRGAIIPTSWAMNRKGA